MRRILLLIITVALAIGPLVTIASSVTAVEMSDYDKKSIYTETPFYDPNACEGATSAGTGSSSVVAIGDSVLNNAKTPGDLEKKLKNNKYTDVTIDAQDSRFITRGGNASPGHPSRSGLEAITDNKDKIIAAGTIVVVLGTNYEGSAFDKALTDFMKNIRDLNKNARVFWVNIVNTGSASSATAANKTIEKYAANQKYNYTVVDWYGLVYAGGSPDKSLLQYPGGYHQSAKGADKYAALIASKMGAYSGTTSPGGTGSGGGSAPETGKDKNAARLWNFLIGKGLTPTQAAGILGNVQRESGFSPTIVNPTSGAYGLLQWLGGRLTNLKKLSNYNTLDVQIDYMWTELNGAYEDKYKALKKSTTLEAAVWIWLVGIETPCGVNDQYNTPPGSIADCKSEFDKRMPYAESWLKKFGGYSSGGSSCETTEIGAPNIIKMFNGAAVKAMDHGPLTKPDTFVIHFTQSSSGEGMDLPNFFLGQGLGYGVQFQVGPTGKIYEYFPMDNMRVTWHTASVNSHAVGVEITGADGMALIKNKAQFDAVASLSKYVCEYYKMPCSDPKAEITNSSVNQVQGLVGHSEVPTNDHSDPDVKITNGTQYNICTDERWSANDRKDASVHAYMLKLRRALGYSKFVTGKSGCADGGAVSGLL